MTPIINPWVFYFMHIADGAVLLLELAALICGLTALTLIIVGVLAIAEAYGDEDDPDFKNGKKLVKLGTKLVIATIALVVTAFIIPNSRVISQMIIAQYATPDNIESAFTAVLDGANRLMEVIKQ